MFRRDQSRDPPPLIGIDLKTTLWSAVDPLGGQTPRLEEWRVAYLRNPQRIRRFQTLPMSLMWYDHTENEPTAHALLIQCDLLDKTYSIFNPSSGPYDFSRVRFCDGGYRLKCENARTFIDVDHFFAHLEVTRRKRTSEWRLRPRCHQYPAQDFIERRHSRHEVPEDIGFAAPEGMCLRVCMLVYVVSQRFCVDDLWSISSSIARMATQLNALQLEIFRSNLYAWHARLFYAGPEWDKIAAAVGLMGLPTTRVATCMTMNDEMKPCSTVVRNGHALCREHAALLDLGSEAYANEPPPKKKQKNGARRQ